MTLPVTADGKAEKKIYYTRLFYDRITFRTEGSYIPPIYGCAGEDVSVPEEPEIPEAPEEPEVPEEPETPEVPGIPDTGDRLHVAGRLIMATVAAGAGWVVLLCVRRIYAKLVNTKRR